MSQGTLQYLFEFQTQVALLTGMEVANASLYDGATACAEAVMMANRLTGRNKAVLSGGLHPHYREVCADLRPLCRLRPRGAAARSRRSRRFGAASRRRHVVRRRAEPRFLGRTARLGGAGARPATTQGALLVVVVTEIVSLGAVRPPGEMGADIVAAEGQSLGNALNFGGPYLGLFASRDKFVRQMPGRLVGQTVDADGRRGWVLTLSTREQHIRRERATSNICTNSGLCALAFTIHLALLGEAGLTRLARLNHAAAVASGRAARAGAGRAASSTAPSSTNSRCACRARRRRSSRRSPKGAFSPAFRSAGSIPDRPELADLLLVAATETTTDRDIDRLAQAMAEALS